jgi:hypothetical protein
MDQHLRRTDFRFERIDSRERLGWWFPHCRFLRQRNFLGVQRCLRKSSDNAIRDAEQDIYGI